MLSNKLLYGTDDVPPIPKEVADERVELLRENLKREMDKPLMRQNNNTQYQILKAIRFWYKVSNREDMGL